MNVWRYRPDLLTDNSDGDDDYYQNHPLIVHLSPDGHETWCGETITTGDWDKITIGDDVRPLLECGSFGYTVGFICHRCENLRDSRAKRERAAIVAWNQGTARRLSW